MENKIIEILREIVDAANENNEYKLKELLKTKNYDINMIDPANGNTVLYPNTKIILYNSIFNLLKCGLNPHLKNKNGINALESWLIYGESCSDSYKRMSSTGSAAKNIISYGCYTKKVFKYKNKSYKLIHTSDVYSFIDILFGWMHKYPYNIYNNPQPIEIFSMWQNEDKNNLIQISHKLGFGSKTKIKFFSLFT